MMMMMMMMMMILADLADLAIQDGIPYTKPISGEHSPLLDLY